MIRCRFVALAAILSIAGTLLLAPHAAWSDTGEALILGSMGTDIAVTEVLRARGHLEANDWQRNRVSGYAIKGVVALTTVAWRRHLIESGHGRAAKVLTVAVVGLSATAIGLSIYHTR